jgi:hypothetical protein
MQNAQSMTVRNFLIQEMTELGKIISGNKFEDEKEKWEAQLKLVELQKEANGLLLDIKKNTINIDEFNKPSMVRALTYYDYKSRESGSSTMTFNDAKFVMQITAPQTIDDVQKMMNVMRKSLGGFIQQQERAGYKNQELLR